MELAPHSVVQEVRGFIFFDSNENRLFEARIPVKNTTNNTMELLGLLAMITCIGSAVLDHLNPRFSFHQI